MDLRVRHKIKSVVFTASSSNFFILTKRFQSFRKSNFLPKTISNSLFRSPLLSCFKTTFFFLMQIFFIKLVIFDKHEALLCQHCELRKELWDGWKGLNAHHRDMYAWRHCQKNGATCLGRKLQLRINY